MKSWFSLRLGIVITVLVIAFLQSCTLLAKDKSKLPVIGWIDSNCFAVAKKDITNKTEIFIVTLDGPQKITSAKIIGAAKTDTCGPLAADRIANNISQGLSFYEISAKSPFGLAIGIIGNIGKSNVKGDAVFADITGDGKLEQFSMCATSEGLSFDIWKSKPFKGKPIWSGYYYLGYDVERTCP